MSNSIKQFSDTGRCSKESAWDSCGGQSSNQLLVSGGGKDQAL
ncbi:MAG: hypothetical protein ABJB76_02960 [Candidatus Nitrosocosmicus sp.]